jgi:hypothetical protein
LALTIHAGVFDCELPQGWCQAWSEEHCAFFSIKKMGVASGSVPLTKTDLSVFDGNTYLRKA